MIGPGPHATSNVSRTRLGRLPAATRCSVIVASRERHHSLRVASSLGFRASSTKAKWWFAGAATIVAKASRREGCPLVRAFARCLPVRIGMSLVTLGDRDDLRVAWCSGRGHDLQVKVLFAGEPFLPTAVELKQLRVAGFLLEPAQHDLDALVEVYWLDVLRQGSTGFPFPHRLLTCGARIHHCVGPMDLAPGFRARRDCERRGDAERRGILL